MQNKTITLNLNKTNQQKEKSSREATRNSKLHISIPRNPMKILNWESIYLFRGPGVDLCHPHAYYFIISQFK